jgi:hypothetical protein
MLRKKLSLWSARIIASFTILVLSSGSALAAGVQPTQHGPMVRLRHGTSSNWSGYAAYNNTFNSVSASWVQPAVTCTTQNTYSSYWVGLDGYNSSSVEQLGTEADCSGGVASYYAWYEMYPKRGFYINMGVASGNNFSASVTYSGGKYVLSLANSTTHQTFSTSQRANSAKRTSAEVVVEAPYNGGILPLANFGSAGFTNSLANGQPIGNYTFDRITMLNPYGMKATPTSLDSTNTAFSVDWSAN